MNVFFYNLPPVQEEVHSDCKDLQGILEIEVSHISFITLEKEQENFLCKKEKSVEAKGQTNFNDTPKIENNEIKNNNNSSINSLLANEISQEIYNIKRQKENCNKNNNKSLNSVQVKFVWFGENTEDAANISISCAPIQQQHQEQQQQIPTKSKKQQQQENCKFEKNTKRIKRQHLKRNQKHKYQQEYLLLSANNKLRYRICTSGPLFLEYLRSCKPIKIIVYTTKTTTASRCGDSSSSGSSTLASSTKPLGQAQIRLPSVLLRKFNHNIAKGHNFEYKTKVYTLYTQNKTNLNVLTIVKSGEIQLRFKMLFAPTAAAAAAAAVSVKHSSNILHEEQLTSSLHPHHHNHRHLNGKSKVPDANQCKLILIFSSFLRT